MPIIAILKVGNEKAYCKKCANRNPNGNTNENSNLIANVPSSEEEQNIIQHRTSEDLSNNRNNIINKKYEEI